MPIEELEEMRNEENFIDPVCGMVVSKDTYKLIYGNVEYRFCSKVCLEKFMLTPLKFLNQVNKNYLIIPLSFNILCIFQGYNGISICLTPK